MRLLKTLKATILNYKMSSSWSDSLSGMNITSYKQDGNVTTLVGNLREQAALAGVLQTLYDFPICQLNIKDN